jgi:hypothetical protein
MAINFFFKNKILYFSFKRATYSAKQVQILSLTLNPFLNFVSMSSQLSNCSVNMYIFNYTKRALQNCLTFLLSFLAKMLLRKNDHSYLFASRNISWNYCKVYWGSFAIEFFGRKFIRQHIKVNWRQGDQMSVWKKSSIM